MGQTGLLSILICLTFMHFPTLSQSIRCRNTPNSTRLQTENWELVEVYTCGFLFNCKRKPIFHFVMFLKHKLRFLVLETTPPFINSTRAPTPPLFTLTFFFLSLSRPGAAMCRSDGSVTVRQLQIKIEQSIERERIAFIQDSSGELTLNHGGALTRAQQYNSQDASRTSPNQLYIGGLQKMPINHS